LTVLTEIPGLSRVREHFLDLLPERLETIAMSLQAASHGVDPAQIAALLEPADITLHRIAGAAGSLKLGDLGAHARRAELEVAAYRFACRESDPSDFNRVAAEIEDFVAAASAV